MNCLIVGCGYLGRIVAQRWIASGDSVYALTRSSAKNATFEDKSITPIVVDWYKENGWPTLPILDRVLVCASHAAVPRISPIDTHCLGLKNLFHHLVSSPATFTYLSTTGVYSACYDGQWIDENSPVGPRRPGSIAALAAEHWIAKHVPPRQYTILRAAGIYGPGRIPRLDKLIANEPIEADPESYLNLIHVEDLARITVASMDDFRCRGVYNVSDGQPVLRREYYQFIAKTIGAANPRFCDPASIQQNSNSPHPRSRGEGNKRISNQLWVQSFKYRFLFPNYNTGLKPLLLDSK